MLSIHSNESQHLAEGTEVARLRRRFSFVLQQSLSFGTRHHRCRQGMARADSSARQARCLYTRIVPWGEPGREGANGVRGRIGVGGGIGVEGGNGDGNGVGVGTGT